jgi:hypothetical protein
MSPNEIAAFPVVLVHGDPETGAMWGVVAEFLDRSDVRRPNLQGFDCPVPDGFDGFDGFETTKEAYADRPVVEFEAVGCPCTWRAMTGAACRSFLRPEPVPTSSRGGWPTSAPWGRRPGWPSEPPRTPTRATDVWWRRPGHQFGRNET